ncbi:MAG: RNA polymerase sigma factor [Turneriella sp.]|nr:RNA polymerase sigma factor [Turneriella sp.]
MHAVSIQIDTVFRYLAPGRYSTPSMDSADLKNLYFTYAKKIHRYLNSLTRSEEWAFDLMQETFLAADRYYKEGKVENVEAWLIGIARNQFKKAAMSENRRGEQSLEGVEPAAAPAAEDRPDFSALRDRIVERLRQVKPVLAEIFILRLDLNLTHAQIAESTDLPLITVRRHFEKVRAIIEQDFGEELRGGGHGE